MADHGHPGAQPALDPACPARAPPYKIEVDNVLGDAVVVGLLAVVLPSRLEGSSTSLLWIAVVLLLLIAMLTRLQGLAPQPAPVPPFASA